MLPKSSGRLVGHIVLWLSNRSNESSLEGAIANGNNIDRLVSLLNDITYLRTWLHLAVVLDLYSRKVVGWSMKPTLARELVLDALLMAVWRRKPAQPVIVHSDQGSQYGSDDWQRFCRSHQLHPSMSRRGNYWDNAVAESFFSSLKKERVRKRIYKTPDLCRADVFDYIEVFYNRTRRHTHLGGISHDAVDLRRIVSQDFH